MTKAKKPSGSQHERVREARAPGRISIANGPFERMSECRGTSKREVNVDVIERDGKMAAGSAGSGEPKRKAEGKDDKRVPEGEGASLTRQAAHRLRMNHESAAL